MYTHCMLKDLIKLIKQKKKQYDTITKIQIHVEINK